MSLLGSGFKGNSEYWCSSPSNQYTDVMICLKPRVALRERRVSEDRSLRQIRNYTEDRKQMKLLNMIILEAKWKKMCQKGRTSKCCSKIKKRDEVYKLITGFSYVYIEDHSKTKPFFGKVEH